MKIFEIINPTGPFYVAFSQAAWGGKVDHLTPVGVFQTLQQARKGVLHHFTLLTKAAITSVQKQKQELDSEEAKDMIELYKDDLQNAKEKWRWTGYVAPRTGARLWDFGSGDYVYTAKEHAYPILADFQQKQDTGPTLQ
jgi:hypothetical protein